jgi:hypothetical protein
LSKELRLSEPQLPLCEMSKVPGPKRLS